MDTAREIIATEGVEFCTHAEIARRTGLGKPTIYRRWPSQAALVFDAVLSTGAIPLPDTGSARTDLIQGLQGFIATARSPVGGAVGRTVLAEALTDATSREDFAQRRWNRDREAVAGVLRRGAARGERIPAVPPALLAEVLIAWAIDRCFNRDEPPTEDEIGQVVDVLLGRA